MAQSAQKNQTKRPFMFAPDDFLVVMHGWVKEAPGGAERGALLSHFTTKETKAPTVLPGFNDV